MDFLFLKHLCGGNDGADGGGTVLSYLSDWENAENKVEMRRKMWYFLLDKREGGRKGCM